MSLNTPLAWTAITDNVRGPTDTIDEKIVKEAANEAARQLRADGDQRRTLRYGVCFAVIFLLLIELWAVFLIIVWQGRGHFILERWTFGFMTNGVLVQTFLSLRTIIIHLFPTSEKVQDVTAPE